MQKTIKTIGKVLLTIAVIIFVITAIIPSQSYLFYVTFSSLLLGIIALVMGSKKDVSKNEEQDIQAKQPYDFRFQFRLLSIFLIITTLHWFIMSYYILNLENISRDSFDYLGVFLYLGIFVALAVSFVFLFLNFINEAFIKLGTSFKGLENILRILSYISLLLMISTFAFFISELSMLVTIFYFGYIIIPIMFGIAYTKLKTQLK